MNKLISISFDATPMLDRKKSGVGYYVSDLIRHLSDKYHKEIQLEGYYFNFLNKNNTVTPAYTGVNFKPLWAIPGRSLSAFRRIGIQPPLSLYYRSDSDIIFFTNYVSLPVPKSKKIILAIYDLGFLDCPEYVQEQNLAYLSKFCPPSILRADIIVTISESVKERIIHHFPECKAKIVVTPIPPYERQITNVNLPSRLAELGLAKDGYLLYIGTIEPRKNIVNLIEAYCALPEDIRQKHSLVLAGGKGWRDEAILSTIHSYQTKGYDIIQTGYVSDDERDALYNNASGFVNASHYEGFGMPVLEAMQYNLPVAISDIPVFHEVAGDAALYFNKNNVPEITHVLLTLLTDKSIRHSLIVQGSEQLKSFNWSKNTRAIRDAINSLEI
jgi:glycosyltransferase involved in cell wall biosynthesis